MKTKPLPATPAGDPTTIPELKHWYRARERALYLAALERHGWNAHHAARELGVVPTAVQKAIDRHGLREQYDEHGPSSGRPRKVAT